MSAKRAGIALALRALRARSSAFCSSQTAAQLSTVCAVRLAEDVRVAGDHLGGDAAGDPVEVEEAPLLGHLRVVDHLQQQVADLALQVGPVLALDRVRDLVGLLDRVGGDAGEGLLDVPRAAALRVPQAAHHRQQLLDPAHRSWPCAALAGALATPAAGGRRPRAGPGAGRRRR